MKRYKYLDIARGIGLMLVIISHSCGLNDYLIYYYIQLFFILSGYVYHEGRSYSENIGRKAKRLLVPYFAYSAILWVFYALVRRNVSEMGMSALGILYSRYSLFDTTTHTDNIYLFTIANGAMWYLTAAFSASVVYYLVIDKCLKSKKYLIGCTVVLLAITAALAELPILLPWSIDTACAAALYMICGTLLARKEFFEKKWNIPLIIGTFVVYVALVYINPGLNMSIREYGCYGIFSIPLFMLVGITGSMLCIWLAKWIQNTILGTVLAYIGNNTIILLSFHLLGFELFTTILGKFVDISSLGPVPFALYHVVRITVSVCGCLVLDKVFTAIKKTVKVRCGK